MMENIQKNQRRTLNVDAVLSKQNTIGSNPSSFGRVPSPSPNKDAVSPGIEVSPICHKDVHKKSFSKQLSIISSNKDS